MKFLLVNPPNIKGYHVMRSYSGGFGDLFEYKLEDGISIFFPPTELLMLAGEIQSKGHEVIVRDYQVTPFDELEFINILINDSIDYLIHVISLPTLENDCKISQIAKQTNPKIKVYIRSSITHEDVLEKVAKISGADKIIFPDSIGNIIDIVEGTDHSNTASLDNEGKLFIAEVNRVNDIDQFAMPARDLVDHRLYTFENFRSTPRNNIATIHSSYGCPHPCGFYCPYPLAEGKKVRMHSVNRMMQEMKQIKKLGITGVVFRDPLFTYNQKRIEEFCRQLIAEKLEIDWWCETRIDRLSFELLKLMKQAGCVGLEVGVESGDEKVLLQQAKRGLDLKKLENFHNWIRELDIHTVYLFLVGLPVETPQSIVKTYRLMLEMELLVDEYNLSFITPYLGTPLYYEAIEKGWILENWDHFSGYSIVMRTDNLSKEKMQEAYEFGEELNVLIREREQETNERWDKRKNLFITRIENWANQDAKEKIEVL
ncbi:radical SAM protein [Paenibacillus sp. KS-LC4]|uniref:B12-binding domain-containing radical SAM protein n=1 Tax=Paenibacillus sp. KS-LC4 TaxID=2979727 RepID=UPI0030D1A892